MKGSREAAAWDREYRAGRYEQEPPVTFVQDVLGIAGEQGLIGGRGLYIGCGNGRNYLPLVEGGLDLVGLDISAVAIDQLAKRVPGRRSRLVVGDLTALAADERFPIVVALQVFQHGDRATAYDHVRAAQERVASGGLMCVRVNAVGTDIEHRHTVTETSDGALTVRYDDGPKAGLDVHFFSCDELAQLFDGWDELLSIRSQVTQREPAERGQWTQWEAIWQKPAERQHVSGPRSGAVVK